MQFLATQVVALMQHALMFSGVAFMQLPSLICWHRMYTAAGCLMFTVVFWGSC
jgi:hypothetical protein